MTETQAAHLRMISTLPVRTHERKGYVDRRAHRGTAGGRGTRILTAKLGQAIQRLNAEGLRQHQIADRLGVSQMTISKHLRGKIKSK